MSRKRSMLLTILGTAVTGMAIGIFLTPNKIVGGGASGLSTILFHTLKIPPGLSFIVFNLCLLLIGIRILGKEFIIKTLIGGSLLSGFVQIFSMIPIHMENVMLATIFGGVLYGIGIGMSFAAGASTGGTDILGRLIQAKYGFIPIGKLLLYIDGAVILVSLMIFKNLELVLYGVMALFLSTYFIDFIINKLNASRMVFVITDKGEEISEKLVSTSPRGVTKIDVTGVYSNTAKSMLFCVLKDSELEHFQNKILSIDENAFVVFAESQKIMGNGFYLYK